MPDGEKRADIILLSGGGLHQLGAITSVLESSGALIERHDPSQPSFAAIGELEDTDNGFGPVLKLTKTRHTLSVRIPWQHIAGIISGVDRDTDVKELGFAPAVRAKKSVSA